MTTVVLNLITVFFLSQAVGVAIPLTLSTPSSFLDTGVVIDWTPLEIADKIPMMNVTCCQYVDSSMEDFGSEAGMFILESQLEEKEFLL